MNDLQLHPVESALLYTADFTDVLPALATVSTVAWSGSPSLTLDQQYDDFANNKSTIRVAGPTHGVTYLLQAKAALSNGETLAKDMTLRGFNG